MEDLKRYRTPAEFVLIIALMVSLGVNVVDTDEGYLPYGCDRTTVSDTFAYKLSRVNDNGVQRNAYYDRDNSRKYKVCSTGWFLLSQAPQITEPQVEEKIVYVEKIIYKDVNVRVLAYMPDGTKYWCTEPGPDQECVRADDMELPI